MIVRHHGVVAVATVPLRGGIVTVEVAIATAVAIEKRPLPV